MGLVLPRRREISRARGHNSLGQKWGALRQRTRASRPGRWKRNRPRLEARARYGEAAMKETAADRQRGAKPYFSCPCVAHTGKTVTAVLAAISFVLTLHAASKSQLPIVSMGKDG